MIISKYTGTQTEKNLHAAFAGESQARNKYVYFSSVAKKEALQKWQENSARLTKLKNVMNSVTAHF